MPVGADFDDLDRIVPFAFSWEWILARLGDPKPAAVVEGHVQGLGDVWIGRDELNLKARRKMKTFQLVLSGKRRSCADIFSEWIAGARFRSDHSSKQSKQNEVLVHFCGTGGPPVS